MLLCITETLQRTVPVLATVTKSVVVMRNAARTARRMIPALGTVPAKATNHAVHTFVMIAIVTFSHGESRGARGCALFANT